MCEGCQVTYFQCIARFFEKNDISRQFLREHGVLSSVVHCPKCEKECSLREDGQYIWRCSGSVKIAKTKRRRYCDYSVSDFNGTFLENTKVPAWKIILFVNHWLSKHWDHSTVIKCLSITSHTSVDWRSFCSEVTDFWFTNQKCIGGPGIVVEIDETLIVRRKYERGRVLSQVWLFGGIERLTKKKFVVPLVGPLGEGNRRDKGTLVPLIQRYIRAGSVIISDEWGAYNTLKDLGYTHHTINHSENFVNPSDCDVHTQNVERLWRDVKEWVKRPGIRSKFLYQYLARYLFIKAHEEDSLVHEFFVQAAALYPPQGAHKREVVPLIDDDSSDDE